MKTARVLLVDDHALLRKSLINLLQEEADLTVVGEATNGREAYELVASLQPDLVLMDINMPGADGIEGTRLIKEAYPDVTVIMLTVSERDEDLFEAIKSGARGYLVKDIDPEQLASYLRRAAAGEPVFSGALAMRILDEFARSTRPYPTMQSGGDGEDGDRQRLTDREIEVLELVAQGHTNRDIAEQLLISENTVKKHLSHILEKLQLENRVQAAAYAVQRGVIDPELLESD